MLHSQSISYWHPILCTGQTLISLPAWPCRSPQLSSRHYLDMQRVANRVWLQHFQHKDGLRGKVVETFEQLSSLADIMSAKITTIQEQLSRSKVGTWN